MSIMNFRVLYFHCYEIQILLYTYGGPGTILLLASISLHIVFAGALLKRHGKRRYQIIEDKDNTDSERRKRFVKICIVSYEFAHISSNPYNELTIVLRRRGSLWLPYRFVSDCTKCVVALITPGDCVLTTQQSAKDARRSAGW